MSRPPHSAASLADNASIQSNVSSTDPSTFSSGPTTPADEILPSFHPALVRSCNVEFAGDCAQYEEITTPKPRSLAKGLRQVKKFAQNLMKSKEVKTKILAALPSVPKSNLSVSGRFTTRRRRDRSKIVLGLPNQQLSLRPERRSVSSYNSLLISQFLDGTIPGNNTPAMSESLDSIDGIFTSIHDVDPTSHSMDSSFAVMMIPLFVAKMICFVPWCVAVGGALLLFPQNLEFIAFQTGYLKSVQGIQRFAHWANYASDHLMIFIAFTFAVGYCNTSFGATLGAFVLARFIYVWQDFKFDRSIPLGQDDRQSMYMVAMMEDYGIREDTVIYGVGEDKEICQSVIVDDDAWLRRLERTESA